MIGGLRMHRHKVDAGPSGFSSDLATGRQSHDLVNFADVVGEGWRFLESICPAIGGSWHFYRTNRVSWLEKRLARPNIARYRNALDAARCASRLPNPVFISHLPRATLALEAMATAMGLKTPHLAFAFNFTDLPKGISRSIFINRLKRVSRFTVFSRFEQTLYADWLDIDPRKLEFVYWAMERPEPAPTSPVSGDYIFAGGGEGRDYGTLIEAMRHLPRIPIVIQARPHNLAGISLPDNVTAFVDYNPSRFWRFIEDSRFMVLPLRDDRTACGHITIVGALLLGKPIVATQSHGLIDYTSLDHSLLCHHGDAKALAESIELLWNDQQSRSRMSANAMRFAQTNCDLRLWCEHLRRQLEML
jgi:glycosyltransferase involved in cell wall biosynthesis